jgi:hypothetical protein
MDLEVLKPKVIEVLPPTPPRDIKLKIFHTTK